MPESSLASAMESSQLPALKLHLRHDLDADWCEQKLHGAIRTMIKCHAQLLVRGDDDVIAVVVNVTKTQTIYRRVVQFMGEGTSDQGHCCPVAMEGDVSVIEVERNR